MREGFLTQANVSMHFRFKITIFATTDPPSNSLSLRQWSFLYNIQTKTLTQAIYVFLMHFH